MKFDNIITMNTSIIVGGRRHYFNFIMVLIHGYNNGTILKNMIQYEINSKRISMKYRDVYNKGVTTLLIDSRE